MYEAHEKARTSLHEKFASVIKAEICFRDELTFIVELGALLDVIDFLRSEGGLAYDFLTDLTATDWPERADRFEVIYLLYSFASHTYIRIKVRCREGEKVPTLTGIWDSANWMEREVFDLFGVEFEGHPDMKRILMWDEFEGHPLRKDFPLTYEMPQFSHNLNDPPEVIK